MFVLLAVLLTSPSVDPTWLETEWDSAENCVDSGSLQTRAVSLLGPGRTPPETRVTLLAMASPTGWQVEMTLATMGGPVPVTRSLHGEDCETLTEAIALVVAVHVDPLAVAATLPTQTPLRSTVSVPRPLSFHRTSATPLPSAPAPGPTTPAAPQLSRPRLALGTVVGGEAGVLPRGAVTVELSAAAVWRRASVAVVGQTSLGPPAVESVGMPAGARMRLLVGAVRGCGIATQGQFEIPLCGAVEAGNLRAEGTGLVRSLTVNAPWLAAVFGARPRWVPRRRFAVVLATQAVIPIIRHSFAGSDTGLVHRVWDVAVRVGLGFEFRFL